MNLRELVRNVPTAVKRAATAIPVAAGIMLPSQGSAQDVHVHVDRTEKAVPYAQVRQERGDLAQGCTFSHYMPLADQVRTQEGKLAAMGVVTAHRGPPNQRNVQDPANDLCIADATQDLYFHLPHGTTLTLNDGPFDLRIRGQGLENAVKVPINIEIPHGQLTRTVRGSYSIQDGDRTPAALVFHDGTLSADQIRRRDHPNVSIDNLDAYLCEFFSNRAERCGEDGSADEDNAQGPTQGRTRGDGINWSSAADRMRFTQLYGAGSVPLSAYNNISTTANDVHGTEDLEGMAGFSVGLRRQTDPLEISLGYRRHSGEVVAAFDGAEISREVTESELSGDIRFRFAGPLAAVGGFDRFTYQVADEQESTGHALFGGLGLLLKNVGVSAGLVSGDYDLIAQTNAGDENYDVADGGFFVGADAQLSPADKVLLWADADYLHLGSDAARVSIDVGVDAQVHNNIGVHLMAGYRQWRRDTQEDAGFTADPRDHVTYGMLPHRLFAEAGISLYLGDDK